MLVGGVALMLAGVLGSCGSTAAAPGLFSGEPDAEVSVSHEDDAEAGQRRLDWQAIPLRPEHREHGLGRAAGRSPACIGLRQMPRLVEETRCVLSPGRQGFPSGAIFCHSPDNKIYEISADGSSETVFATLPAPYPPAADGALAFDTVGRFGYRLLAATGRSGGAKPAGGLVYAIDAHGQVQRVGSYAGPGGADELVIAPRRFGSVAGDALLTVDAGARRRRVVALNSSGRTRTVATLPTGLNPIAAIPTVPE